MANETDIANIAITELGGEPITNLADENRNADVCRSRIRTVIDSCLRLHTWKCARRRFSLPVLAEPPEFGFTRAFALPATPYCLRVIGLEDKEAPWEVQGRQILTNEGGPLRGYYIARIGVEDMDALLAEFVAFRLAAAVGYRLTQSFDKAEKMRARSNELLREARSINALEGDSRGAVEASSDFIDARW